MVSALRPRALLLVFTAALVLAGCGANGEGAPASGGCPVGTTASTCSSSSSGNATSASCSTQTGTDSFNEVVNISNTTADGLQYGDITIGCGAVVQTGQTVSVMYTGWLESNGQQFDTSRQPGRGPFSVTLGQHQVIPGWEEGIPGMKVGGKRRLVIPAALGYGAQGQPPTIPANATLVFDVEVLSAH